MIVCAFALGSAPAATVALVSERFGGCLFIVDPDDAVAVAMRPVLERFAGVVVTKRAEDVAAALNGARPHGVVTFTESGTELCADLAARFGLPGISLEAAARLSDKKTQRERLNECGVGLVRSVAMIAAAPPPEIPLPAVVKPRAGAGSTDTVFVRTMSEFSAQVARLNPGRAYVVEQYIQGAEAPLGPWLADYVSVESAVDAAGRIIHLGITGRLPLAPPARETGLIFPLRPARELSRALTQLAEQAITALGLSARLVHTEIKLTADGPVVIEVNGRLGGGLFRLMPKAGAIEPVGLAVALAAGEPIPQALPRATRHALHYYVQPPFDAIAVSQLPEPRQLRALPGVFGADPIARAGDQVDWRRGSLGRIYDIWLHAESLAELERHTATLDKVLASQVRWEFASGLAEPARVRD